MRKLAVATCLSVGALTMTTAAQAEVILLGPVSIQPSGLGTVSTILTMQSQGNATDETGRTSYNGSTSVVTSLVNPPGAAQPGVDTTTITGGANNQARTFAELGLTQASDLRVVLNIVEPAGSTDILLRSLVFTAYNASGTAVFTAQLAGAPLTLTALSQGTGSSGYAFGLSTGEAAQLQALFSPTLRLGITSSISNAQGGSETFFGTSARSIPEPSTLALLGLSLAGFGFARRKKSG